MRAGLLIVAVVITFAMPQVAFAQSSDRSSPLAARFIDAADGLTLEAAIEQALRQGRNVFAIEFHRPDGQLVDVGAVRASANMPMPGMVMSSGLQLSRSGVAGRYEATAEFGMAGAWHMAIEWEGPAGRGSVNFEGAVR